MFHYATTRQWQLRFLGTLRLFPAVLIMLLQLGCDFGSYNKQLNTDYSLNGLDGDGNVSLYYSDDGKLVGVVNYHVLAYIVQNSFIAVTKKHSNNDNSVEEDYYFVPLTEPFITNSGETNVSGPLSLDEVTSLAVERGATAPLEFTAIKE